jgi:hypothetical protein
VVTKSSAAVSCILPASASKPAANDAFGVSDYPARSRHDRIGLVVATAGRLAPTEYSRERLADLRLGAMAVVPKLTAWPISKRGPVLRGADVIGIGNELCHHDLRMGGSDGG